MTSGGRSVSEAEPLEEKLLRWGKMLGDFLAGLAAAPPQAIGPTATVAVPLGSFHTEPVAPTAMSRELIHCHLELARRYNLLKADFEKETGHQLFITCTFRPVEEQYRLWLIGRTDDAGGRLPKEQWDRLKIVTNIDGRMLRGRHNVFPSEAIDLCVDLDPGTGKTVSWNDSVYQPLGALAVKHGLVWGGAWVGFKDLPHLELPLGID